MGQDEKIKEAQEILDWAIMHLNMPVQISEEWIKGTNPRENLIHDKLKTLLNNLENY